MPPNFSLAIDAIVPPGPTPVASYFLTPGTPLTPTLIDPANDSVAPGNYSLIQWQGNLYRILLNKSISPGSINAWVSTDLGNTWSMIAAPLTPRAGAVAVQGDDETRASLHELPGRL